VLLKNCFRFVKLCATILFYHDPFRKWAAKISRADLWERAVTD